MTKIEWTDRTWNPIAGCTPISPGCANCYAATMARRLAAMAQADIHKGRKPGRKRKYIGTAERRGHVDVFTGKIGFDEAITEPLTWAKPSKVFVNSESDLFHEAVPDGVIDSIVSVMALCPHLTFQVLTKRADRMFAYMSAPDLGNRIYRQVSDWLDEGEGGTLGRAWDRAHDLAGSSVDHARTGRWTAWRLPLANLWLGVSVEDQQRADERIPHLLSTPAALRFLSCEPLLGPLDLSAFMEPRGTEWVEGIAVGQTGGSDIGWCIAGGESGPLARPAHPDWFRALRDQCAAAGVPYFFKQWGNWVPRSAVFPDGKNSEGLYQTTERLPRSMSVKTIAGVEMLDVGKKASGRLLDGREHNEFPRVEVAS